MYTSVHKSVVFFVVFLFSSLLYPCLSFASPGDFCFFDWNCACNERCSRGACESIINTDTAQFCSNHYIYNNAWAINNHAIQEYSQCGVINSKPACSQSDRHECQLLGCSQGCGASCGFGLPACQSGYLCAQNCACVQVAQSACEQGNGYDHGTCIDTAGPGPSQNCLRQGKVIDTSLGCNDPSFDCCIGPTPIPLPCTSGQTNCSVWSIPSNNCANNNASRTCYHNAGSTNCILSPYTDRTTIPNCASNYVCNSGTCETNLTVHVFLDDNHNGIQENTEPGLANIGILLNTGAQGITDSNGNIIFNHLVPATYSVSISKPSDSLITLPPNNSPSQTIVLNSQNGNPNLTFGIAHYFSVSGIVYNDINQSETYENSPDTPIGSGTISINGNGTTLSLMPQQDGTYTSGKTLLAGNYTVAYTNIPLGFKRVYPGNPGAFAISVGRPNSNLPCSTKTYRNASCDTVGDISNLSFSLTNEGPTTTLYCSDARVDTGFIDQLHQTPQTNATCGNSRIQSSFVYPPFSNDQTCTQPGIIFSGTIDPDFGIGQGSPDPYNWQVGSNSYPETFGITNNCPTITTSYDYIRGQIAARIPGNPYQDLSLYCDLNDCQLPPFLPNGIYDVPTDLILSNVIFPEDKHFLFLIGGNFGIKGTITVPSTSTATFIVKKDIHVYSNVGNLPDSFDSNLEGLYSTDGSVIIHSFSEDNQGICQPNGDSRDKKLVIIGSLVVNAACTGGSLINNRTLCASDLFCSTLHISMGKGNLSGQNTVAGTGLNYILNAFSVRPILQRRDFEQELNP